MTTSTFEVRFTIPAEFIEELRRDMATGAVQDNLLRLAVRQHDATFGQVDDKPFRQQGDDRTTPWFKAQFVEAAYISSRSQLVKLSAFCGVIYTGPVSDVEEIQSKHVERGDVARKKIQETVRTLQSAVHAAEGFEVRGGGLYVQEGAWVADPESPIGGIPKPSCGACGEAIYYANDAWRHESTGRADVLREIECPACHGTGEMETTRGTSVVHRACSRCHRTGRRHEFDHSAAPASPDDWLREAAQ